MPTRQPEGWGGGGGRGASGPRGSGQSGGVPARAREQSRAPRTGPGHFASQEPHPHPHGRLDGSEAAAAAALHTTPPKEKQKGLPNLALTKKRSLQSEAERRSGCTGELAGIHFFPEVLGKVVVRGGATPTSVPQLIS